MKISYAVTVCNELDEVQRLITFLLNHKRSEDEICVLVDKPKASMELLNILYSWSSNNLIHLRENHFQGHFADWKNELTKMCSGDFIVQLDADEMPHEYLIEQLPEILKLNESVDLIYIPRINTVDGITETHIQKWGWIVNDKGWVNFPDYQSRIYRNNSKITWINKVHERLSGYSEEAMLPPFDEFCLLHPKTIERQERQNAYYDSL